MSRATAARFVSLAALIAALGVLGRMDFDAEIRERDLYCAMVAEWRGSGGERGWPDYRGIARTECAGIAPGAPGGASAARP